MFYLFLNQWLYFAVLSYIFFVCTSILVTIFFYFVPTFFSISISVVIFCYFIPNFRPLIAYPSGSKLLYKEYKMTEKPFCTSKYYCLIPLSITLLMIVSRSIVIISDTAHFVNSLGIFMPVKGNRSSVWNTVQKTEDNGQGAKNCLLLL